MYLLYLASWYAYLSKGYIFMVWCLVEQRDNIVPYLYATGSFKVSIETEKIIDIQMDTLKLS
jgi:hypothetical protein